MLNPKNLSDGANSKLAERVYAFCLLFVLSGVFYAAFTPIVGGTIAVRAGESLGYQLVWGTTYLLLLIFAITRVRPILRLLSNNVLGSLFLAVIFATSAANGLIGTTQIALMLTLLAAVWLASVFSLSEILAILHRVLLGVIVFHTAILLSIGTPYTSDDLDRDTILGTVAQTGLFPHKNYAGIFFGISTIVFVTRLLSSSGRGSIIGATASTVFLLISGSSGAALATFVGIGSMLGIWAITSRKYFLAFLFLLASAVAAVLALASPTAIFALIGRSSDLTGRAAFWSWWPTFFLKSPWLGFGYGGFFTGEPDAPAFELWDVLPDGFKTPNFHNAFLEAGITSGLAGFVLFTLIVWTALRRGFWLATDSKQPINSAIFAILLAISIFSISESILPAHNTAVTVLFFAFYFKANTLSKLSRTAFARAASIARVSRRLPAQLDAVKTGTTRGDQPLRRED